MPSDHSPAPAITRETLAAALATHDRPWPENVEGYMREYLPPVSLLDRLAKRYAGIPVPACFVCKGKLDIQQIGGGEATVWAHSRPDGVPFADWEEHYRGSRWVQRQAGDSDVLALVELVAELVGHKPA